MADKMDLFRIRRNLTDAGMSEAEISECIKLIEHKQYTALDKLLTKHRLSLLDRVHKYNYCIDCLDYFTHTIKRS